MNRRAVRVNAQGSTPEAVLDDMHGRLDQAVTGGMHLGATLALASLSSQTGEDYSAVPVGFAHGDHPEDVEDIDEQLERYNDHAAAISETTHAQSVLNTLFHDDD